MKVFLCEPIHSKAYALLAENAQIISDWSQCKEVDAIISRTITVGSAEMDKMPNLKVIAVHGTGTDDIDLTAAKARNIQVVSAPHLNAESVAELNVGLLLSLARRIVEARLLIDRDDYQNYQKKLFGTELRGKTAGFIGWGAIATKTAKILGDGLGMKLMAYTPNLTPERTAELNCQCAASLEDMLQAADVVFIATALNAKTENMLDAGHLALMKKGAFVINASRGAIIDENALYDSLSSGHLGGAACDVFCQEPVRKANKLLELPHFVATPHLGANTDEALYAVGMCCVQQILDVLQGKPATYPA